MQYLARLGETWRDGTCKEAMATGNPDSTMNLSFFGWGGILAVRLHSANQREGETWRDRARLGEIGRDRAK